MVELLKAELAALKLSSAERDSMYQACKNAGWEVESGDPERFVAELAAENERIDSFDGHLDWLHEHYPETAFDGSSGDIGAVNVVLSRKLLEAVAELAALKAERDDFQQRLLDELAKNALTPTGRDRLEQAEAAAGAAGFEVALLRDELEALKGRRCETCANGESQGDIIQLVLCRAVERFSNTNTLVVPFTHSCTWWAERG
jgi:hypothetical protein